MEKLKKLAEEIGFTHFCELNTDALVFMPEVREMCATDKCKSYGKSWACPPACGSLETISARASKFSKGLIVQTVCEMEDEFDFDAIRNGEKEHKSKFDTLARQTKMIYKKCLPMASGTCRRCRKCTYPDRPCRFPDRLFPSMEAYGLMVRDVCEKSGIQYYYGKNTITFTACILID